MLRPALSLLQLIEASYPQNKVPVCLPPAKEDSTCDMLAPLGTYNSSHPALYASFGSIRDPGSTREWSTFHTQVAVRLWNYVTYQVAMGVSGLLLYTDELQRRYLVQNPYTRELLRRGHLW